MSDTKINQHTFHGIYSNYGYAPGDINASYQKLWADYPIHCHRAILGAVPISNVSANGQQPKEFQTEKEAFEWYKKNKYTEYKTADLKFPEDSCKNYFTFPEADFFKYRNLFNGMVKGIKVNSDVDIDIEGTVYALGCPICKKDFRDEGAEPGDIAGPIVFQSPNGKPSYFTADVLADDEGYLNGVKITDSNFNEPQTTLSFTAVDTVGGNVRIQATVRWYEEVQYKQKIKFTTNLDSTKIFEISELQKRLPATFVDYRTSIDLNEEKYNEELLYGNEKLFENEWKFNQAVFKSIFQGNKFNKNATFLNDPVLSTCADDGNNGGGSSSGALTSLQKISQVFDFEFKENLNILNKLEAPIFSSLSVPLNDEFIICSLSTSNEFNSANTPINEDTINKQKEIEKKFEKFGSTNYKITNDNSIVTSAINSLDFSINHVFYIKSQKIYLCFIEMNSAFSVSGSAVKTDEECDNNDCEDQTPDNPESLGVFSFLDFKDLISKPSNFFNTLNVSVFESTNPVTFDYFLTTSDTIKNNLQIFRTSECDEESKELELEKIKCDLKIADKTFTFEVFKLKESEFVYDNKNCEDLNSVRKFFRKKVSFNLIKKPTFEVINWKKEDFSKNNIFPPKMS